MMYPYPYPVKWSTRILIAAATVPPLLVAGCGGSDTETVSAAPPSVDCPVQTGALDASDSGAADFVDPGPGGVSEVRHTEENQKVRSTPEALSGMDSVAVLGVVSRRGPIGVDRVAGVRRPGAVRSTPSPTAHPGDTDIDVVRPARFTLVRTIKGSVPSCLDLDVPGGTFGKARQENSRFPQNFKRGDRMLAIFADTETPSFAIALYPADKDGNLTLPFGAEERVNLNTWSPAILPRPTTTLGPGDYTLPPTDSPDTTPPTYYTAPPRPPEKGK